MRASTRFLSRLFGLYLLIVSIVMLLHRQDVLATVQATVNDRPILLLAGVLAVFGGLAIVLVHNLWTGGVATVVVTVLGWLVLFKGVSLLAVGPQGTADFYLVTLHFGDLYFAYAVLCCLVGAFLSYAGFRGRDS
jgi:uncharacterized membrane protein YfcA